MRELKKYNNKSINWYHVSFIITYFLIVSNFYQFYPYSSLKISQYVSYFVRFLLLSYVIILLCRYHNSNIIFKAVKFLAIVIISTIFWGTINRGQSLQDNIIGVFSVVDVFIFFVFQQKKISANSIICAVFVLSLLYCIIVTYSLMMFPDNAFGGSDKNLERALQDLESRNVLRLGIDGANFLAIVFFYILNRFQNNKVFYLFLIIPVIYITLEGTRAYIFGCIIVGVLYLFYSMKNRLIMILLLLFCFVGGRLLYNTLLMSDSDDIITTYVKISSEQIGDSNKGNKDIRIQSMCFYLFEYNTSILQDIFGNGIPHGNSYYSREKMRLAQNGYFTEDVAFSFIFSYYGIVGLFAYFYLLFVLLNTKIAKSEMYSKLFIIYGYIIFPTNVLILCLFLNKVDSI